MFIKNACDVSADDRQKAIELDDTASYVNISEDSRAAIACIPNVIGESVCSLCKVKYEDVFRLAMHRCPRIMHEEYRCPECEKTFSCPANLASHRRWHRPKELTEPVDGDKALKKKTNICSKCSTQFETKSGLRSHRKMCAQTTQKEDHLNMRASQSPPNPDFTLDSLKMAPYGTISADFAANALISLGVSANKTVPVKVLI
uniref:C2H2-type domain-containing protein n=1 Tax=Ditylenchus dipsaci TaxID=166011 RepID=A0A915EX73_9BILA